MELKTYLEIIWRRLWILILMVGIATISTYFLIKNTPVTYKSTFSLNVIPVVKKVSNQEVTYNIQLVDAFTNTILGWFKIDEFVKEFCQRAGEQIDCNKFSTKNIRSTKISTHLINVELISTDKKENIEKLTDSVINVIKDKVTKFNKISKSNFIFAVTPSTPTISTIESNFYFGLAAAPASSFILALILIFLLEYFSPFINRRDEIEQILGKKKVSFFKKISKILPYDHSQVENYRFLKTEIYRRTNKSPADKLIIVGGSVDYQNSEGIIANLATCFARAGKKTILIDLNFKNSFLLKLFNKENREGFSEFLNDAFHPALYFIDTDEENLKLMTVGKNLSNLDLVFSRDFSEPIDVLKKEFDIIIFNLPPLALYSEGWSIIDRFSDHLILTLSLGKTKKDNLQKVKSLLKGKDLSWVVVC